ncbi:MAG: P1 family peptidase [Methanobacteriota archaeon]|nr:MAG: P1 family peptidase [Euryarchaeota archaeon]
MSRPRARDLGIAIGLLPTGKANAVTDVSDIRVGHCTLNRGSGKLSAGRGPIRTGVTVVLPHGRNLYSRPVKGGYHALNGCGGLIGSLQIDEFGLIDTPIGLTNTMGMAAVGEGLTRYTLEQNGLAGTKTDTIIPVVSECDDSYLNDSRGLHVRPEHVFEAIADAGPRVVEGAVGAGTGMVCYDFKGGIGTSSRVVESAAGDHVVGVIVLSNHGVRHELIVSGVPVGRLLKTPDPGREESGSIVTIIATDAPLDARQLGRLARRAGMGLALTGSCAHNGSGDIMISFSTANVRDRHQTQDVVVTEHLLIDREMDGLFRATVDATAEAVLNSLFCSGTMEGRDGHLAPGLPVDATVELLKEYRALS